MTGSTGLPLSRSRVTLFEGRSMKRVDDINRTFQTSAVGSFVMGGVSRLSDYCLGLLRQFFVDV